ncbi:MAG: terminase family protein [Silicimonas sp.]|nr:terminase family protein [Silicimonas sp.]
MSPMPPSISTPSGIRSGASLIASAPPETQSEFLESLSPEEVRALPYLFDFWALPHQVAPEGDWKTWVILGGRGAGKTRAGAEWVRAQVEGARPGDAGAARRVALVGETFDQARDVMVFGESGLLAASPPDRRPRWEAGKRQLVWPNGAVAKVYSAHDYEGLRGPQFDAAWVDELAKWPKAEEAWTMLQFALRLGDHPQQVVTTTPRNVPVLKRILGAESSVMTHAPTVANRAHLAASFLSEIERQFGGTRQGRQEIEGLLIEDVEGALWTRGMLDAAGLHHGDPDLAGPFDRIVVAVDPPMSAREASDECGIVVAGMCLGATRRDWRAVVLADVSLAGASPVTWARAVVEAYDAYGADRVVAEVNQGGNLVAEVIAQVDAGVPVKAVHASRGKAARAEPVAALYEQGRVRHLRGLGALEAQMGLMTRDGFEGRGSPDRVDALVWALTELMIRPVEARPRVRSLGG